RDVRGEYGSVVHRHPVIFFQRPGVDALAAEVEALLHAVQTASPPAPARCRVCGSDSGGGPGLLNGGGGRGGAEPVPLTGVLARVCPACTERLQHEVRQAMERYDAAPLNLPLAVLTAAVLAGLGAVVGAGLAVATHRVFWFVAIGAGLLIGGGTTMAAGKRARPVQVTAAVFTLVSVLLGELLLVGYHLQQQAQRSRQQVDWAAFAQAARTTLGPLGGETAFAVGGALLAAWSATRMAARPKLEARVERA